MTPDEIKALRERLGLTTAGLADRVGVSRRVIQYWEAGTRKPGGAAAILLEQLAKAKATKKGKETS